MVSIICFVSKVKGAKPIEKIQIQVTTGSKHPPEVSWMMDLSRRIFQVPHLLHV